MHNSLQQERKSKALAMVLVSAQAKKKGFEGQIKIVRLIGLY